MKSKFALIFMFLGFAAHSQTWDVLLGAEFDSWSFNRFEIADDKLVLLGGFNLPDNDFENVYMAMKWDSLSFETFGTTEFSHLAYAYQEYSNEVYIGGSFLDYNDVYFQRKIARWDGIEWNSVGLGLWSPVNTIEDMEVYQGKLVVGGSLQDIEGNEDFWPDMGYWEDTTWHTMGGTWGGGGVKELIQYDDKLFVIGEFPWITPDNVLENSFEGQNAVWWNGEEWGVAGEGVNGRLWDAYVDSTTNQLYVCGLCSNASGVDVNNVAMWDGSEWHAVGDGLSNDVFCITMYRGQIYVAGFQIFGEHRIVYFDGYNWQPVPGANIDGTIKDMIVYKDELYIGGFFEEAGGLEVDGLVRYYLHPDSVQWGVPDVVPVLEFEKSKIVVFPNPAGDYIQLRGEDLNLINSTFMLYNSKGQQVLRQVITHNEMSIDIQEQAPGTYSWDIVKEGRKLGFGAVVKL
jgi:hypothetical protein